MLLSSDIVSQIHYLALSYWDGVKYLKAQGKSQMKLLLTCCFFVEASMSADVVTQISTRKIIHDQVQVFPVLKRVVHVDKEDILELGKDLPFIYDRLHTALGDDASLRHLFHGVVLFGLFPFDSPNFSKATLANAKVVDEVCLRYSCTLKSKE